MDYRLIQEAALDRNSILDEETRALYCCTPKKGRKSKMAVSSSGNFCVAFPMKSYKNDSKLCYRIWYTEEFKEKKFDKIAEHVSKDLKLLDLPYFIDYKFLNDAINVGGRHLPGVKMEWIDGERLDNYLKNHRSKDAVLQLAKEFMQMCVAFKKNGISHGDLSNSNILVLSNGEIRLVDYDSVYVPSMSDRFYQTTTGQAAFQHPQRLNQRLKITCSDDNFSQQVIYVSLLAIAQNLDLINEISETELLFTSTDIENVYNFKKKKNELLEKIGKSNNSELLARLEELERAVSGSLSEVRSIVDFKMQESTQILMANYCGTCGHHFNNQADNFCPICGTQRLILK